MQVKMSLKRLNLNLGTFSQMFETLLSVTYFVPRLGYLVGRFPLVFSRENGEKEVSRLFQVQTALQQKKILLSSFEVLFSFPIPAESLIKNMMIIADIY